MYRKSGIFQNATTTRRILVALIAAMLYVFSIVTAPLWVYIIIVFNIDCLIDAIIHEIKIGVQK